MRLFRKGEQIVEEGCLSFPNKFAKIVRPKEWNVDIWRNCETSGNNLITLSFISLATLLVKAIAKISLGSTFFSPIK